MFRIIIVSYLLFGCVNLYGQTYKFYYSNYPKFLKQGTNDTLKMPFTGGLNTPQFQNFDFNNDGKLDLFVFDRAANKPLTFCRDGNTYVYTPQFESQFPRLRSWAILKDYNGDGKPDIFTEVTQDRKELRDTVQPVFQNGLRIFRNISDAQGLKFRLMSNQIKDTGGIWPPPFSVPREAANVAINSSDIPAIDDLDGDGDLDILAYAGFSLSASFYENFAKNKLNIPYANDTVIYILRDECWGYMQFNVNSGQYGKFHIHQTKDQMPSCFFQMYGKHGKHAGTTQLLIDMNNDGVKDIIYGDASYNNLVLLINGRKQNSLGRDSILSQDTLFPRNSVPANFILFPAAYYADVNADDKPEMLVTTNEINGVKSADNVWVYNNSATTASPIFTYEGKTLFINNQTIDLGTRAVPAFTDIDSDGDQDLIVGTSGDVESTLNLNDRLVLFENITDNSQPVFTLKDTNFLLLSKDTPIIHMHPVFADMNGDGKADLLIGNEAGNIIYYQNQSVGKNYQFTLQTRKLGDIDVGSHAAPAVFDFDNNGSPDLVVGNKAGFLKYFKNNGTATVPNFSSAPLIDSLGKVLVNDSYQDAIGNNIILPNGYATPVLFDLDSNGKPELIIGSESGKVFLYENIAIHPDSVYRKFENIFVDYSNANNAKSLLFGSRTAPAIARLDGDSKADIMIGNIRGGLTFYASTNRGGVTPLTPEIPAMKFDLYPNPATNEFYISLSNHSADATYRIYDLVGRLQTEGRISKYHTSTTVHTDSFANGIYILVIKSGDQISTGKILIGK